MRAGDSPTAACAKALQPIAKYYPAASGGLVCLNAQVGRSGALWLTLRPESCSTS
jgi:hypothetical protein